MHQCPDPEKVGDVVPFNITTHTPLHCPGDAIPNVVAMHMFDSIAEKVGDVVPFNITTQTPLQCPGDAKPFQTL
jgi:hypothetical protein